MSGRNPGAGFFAFRAHDPWVAHGKGARSVADGDKTYSEAEVQALIEEQTAGLKKNRDEALTEAKKAKATATDLATRLTDLEQKAKANEAGMTSDQLAKLRGDVQADMEKRYAADPSAGLKAFPWAAQLATENRSLKLDNVVKAEMAKAGARAERIDALFRLTSDRFDLTDDGKPMLRTSPGLEVGKYVAEDLAREYPEFYNGTGSSGGGAPKSNAGGGGGGARQVVGTNNPDFITHLKDIAAGKTQVVT